MADGSFPCPSAVEVLMDCLETSPLPFGCAMVWTPSVLVAKRAGFLE
jgi:hypothetical protein